MTSQAELASRWRWNRETVRQFLRLLERQDMAGIRTSKETETGYTIIRLLNYNNFQRAPKAASAIRSSIRSAIRPPSENRKPPESSAIRSAIGLSPETPGITETYEQDGELPPPSDLPSEPASSRHPIRHYPRREPRREYKYLAGDSAPAGSDASPKEPKGNGRDRRTRKTDPDPNVKRVIDAYHQRFSERFGTPPPINGSKCGSIAKSMLRGRPVEEALWVVREFFASPPPFYRDKGLYGLEHILTAMPTLLARKVELERGM
jgi:hypothetical protein